MAKRPRLALEIHPDMAAYLSRKIRFEVSREAYCFQSGAKLQGPRFREWDTVAQAERSARALVRHHGGACDINMIVTGKNLYRREEVATVRTDAYGRVWTDVNALPGQPALL